MSLRYVVAFGFGAALLMAASSRNGERTVTLTSGQLMCVLEAYPILKGALEDNQRYRAHVTLLPACELELAPERDGKGGGISVRFFADAGYEVLRTK